MEMHVVGAGPDQKDRKKIHFNYLKHWQLWVKNLSFLKISGNTSGGWIWYLPIFIELAFSAPFL